MMEEVKGELSFELKSEMDTVNEKFDDNNLDYLLLEDVNVNDLLQIQDSIVTDISDIVENERDMMSEEEQSLYQLLEIVKMNTTLKKKWKITTVLKKKKPWT